MPLKTYLIRFPNEQSRDQFQEAVKQTPDIEESQIEFGEFLPDAIVRDVTDQTLAEIKRIVDPATRFIEDFQHDLFKS